MIRLKIRDPGAGSPGPPPGRRSRRAAARPSRWGPGAPGWRTPAAHDRAEQAPLPASSAPGDRADRAPRECAVPSGGSPVLRVPLERDQRAEQTRVTGNSRIAPPQPTAARSSDLRERQRFVVRPRGARVALEAPATGGRTRSRRPVPLRHRRRGQPRVEGLCPARSASVASGAARFSRGPANIVASSRRLDLQLRPATRHHGQRRANSTQHVVVGVERPRAEAVPQAPRPPIQ